VHDREQTVSVGEFLNREDSLQLLSLLKSSLRTNTHSAAASRRL